MTPKRNPLAAREHGALVRAQSKGLDKLVTYAGKDSDGDDVFHVPSATRDLRHIVRAKLGKRGEVPVILSCSCESWTTQELRNPGFSRCTHAAAVTLYLSPGEVHIKPLPYARSPKDRNWRNDPEERSMSAVPAVPTGTTRQREPLL